MAKAASVTHTSPRLRYALCDPDGVPFLVAHTPALCLSWYVDMRGGIIVSNASEEQYFKSMLHRGWTVRHIETNVTVRSPVATITEFRRMQRAEEKKDRDAKTKGPEDQEDEGWKGKTKRAAARSHAAKAARAAGRQTRTT